MIGLDTNLLLRYLKKDDLTQLTLVDALLVRLTEERQGYIPLVALAEAAWCLRKSEGATRASEAAGIRRLLRLEHVALQSEKDVVEALDLFESTSAGLSDCLIERCCHSSGCDFTMTFDQKASRAGTFRLMSDESVEALEMESHAG